MEATKETTPLVTKNELEYQKFASSVNGFCFGVLTAGIYTILTTIIIYTITTWHS
jgi:hypothetical protein